MMTVRLATSTSNSKKTEKDVIHGDWYAKVGKDAQTDWGDVLRTKCQD